MPLIASAGKGDLTRGLVLHGLYYYLPLSSLPFSSSPPLLPSSSPSWSLADAIEVPKEYTGPRNDKERGSGCRDLRVLPRWPVYVCVYVCVRVWACASVVCALVPQGSPSNAEPPWTSPRVLRQPRVAPAAAAAAAAQQQQQLQLQSVACWAPNSAAGGSHCAAQARIRPSTGGGALGQGADVLGPD